jgi:hypothetical protein
MQMSNFNLFIYFYFFGGTWFELRASHLLGAALPASNLGMSLICSIFLA